MAEEKKLTKAEKKELRKKKRGSLWKDFKAFINRGNAVSYTHLTLPTTERV